LIVVGIVFAQRMLEKQWILWIIPDHENRASQVC